jgi:DegV family protein with EDD domain
LIVLSLGALRISPGVPSFLSLLSANYLAVYFICFHKPSGGIFMSKVAVVTDSTAYIPAELTEGLPVYSVPLQVIWGSETFRDGIDLKPSEFYTRLQNTKVMPSTSQATPAVFNQLYQQLLDEGYQIISMHISAKLSGTLDSATQAKENFPGASIELIDTETTSMAMGFQVLSVARAAAQGATLQECVELSNQARTKTGVLFAVNTLEFLRRGGRIGGAAAFLGTALNLKPILELRNGRIEAVERVRSMNKAIDRLLDLFEERTGGNKPVRIASLHANAPDEAVRLLERARQRFGEGDVSDSTCSEISPVLGTHTGPGCLGLTFMAGM